MRTVRSVLRPVLACLLVLLVLVAPSAVGHLTPAALLRIPVEGLILVALLVLFAPSPRRVASWIAGVALGVLGVVKLVSLGFSAVLDRQFDPVHDWTFLRATQVYLGQSHGSATATWLVIAAVVLAAALIGAVTWGTVRVSSLAAGHQVAAMRVVGAGLLAWIACLALGVQLVPRVPVAAHDYYDRARQVHAGVVDRDVFAAEVAVDQFRYTPGAGLLTGLRGKDVMVAFVESYGRVAVEDPGLASHIDGLLVAGDGRLSAAGFSSRSAFLTSPTVGGGSWLAHATLFSGLWIDTQQRHDQLVASDRRTLAAAFQQAGWRTAAVMPGNVTQWREADFFGFDRVHDTDGLGYRGPRYSFASMPDQYVLEAFQRLERSGREAGPVMASLVLVSSHSPWSPVPTLVDWDAIGNGSTFVAGPGATDPAEIVLARDRDRVRSDYVRAVEYSLESLISYVEEYGDDDLVLVILGDHQPSRVVRGDNPNRDVPVTIVARDGAVLDRISSWGWHDGLLPGPDAPVWRMDRFRDSFLTAFS